jgi:hypothetical protein
MGNVFITILDKNPTWLTPLEEKNKDDGIHKDKDPLACTVEVKG